MFKVLYHTCLIITKTRSGQKNQEKAKISQKISFDHSKISL